MSKSWRDWLRIHPAADLFPLLDKEDLYALAEDIKQHGLRETPTVIEDQRGKRVLLDGRNRLDALELLGKEISFQKPKQWFAVPSDVDAYAWVTSVNFHRRHLTGEQKRELIANLLKAKPEKSNRQIAKVAGVTHPHVARVRETLEKSGDVETVTTRTDTKGRKQPAKKTHHGKVKAESNEHEDSKDEDFEVEAPEKIKANILDTIDRQKAVACAYKKVLRVSRLDQDARDEVSGAIGMLITTWQSLQRALASQAPNDDGMDPPAFLLRPPIAAAAS